RVHSEESGITLAGEGVARGIWYMNTATGTLQALRAGQALAGYRDDVSYNDNILDKGGNRMDNLHGTFTVNITSGPDINQITIIGTGYPLLNRSVGVVTTIVEDVSVNAAVYVESDASVPGDDWSFPYTFDGQGQPGQDWTLPVQNVPQVHWGPIK